MGNGMDNEEHVKLLATVIFGFLSSGGKIFFDVEGNTFDVQASLDVVNFVVSNIFEPIYFS